MPRVIPRRKQPVEADPPELEAVEGPPPAPKPPPIGPLRLRARETFRCEGVLFQAGDCYPRENDLVQRIHAECPHLFEFARVPS